MEITKLEGGGRVPPTLQGGTPVSTSSPVNLTGTTHTQKIESSMPQSGDYSVCGAVSAAPLSAASQLKADEGKQLTIPDYDIPSQSGERCLGLAVPVSHSAANLNQKSVIVSCVVSPPSPTAGGCPPSGGQMSALTSGPQTTTTDKIKNNDTEQDTDNNRRAMGYKNAISNTNCSSIDVVGCVDTRTSTKTNPTTPSSTPGCSQCAVCEPVYASLSECPHAGLKPSTIMTSSPAITSTGECSKPKPNKTRLSQEYVQPLHGWKLPPGGGLRGGAPLPGETSAISNGTSGWGPPPSSSVHSSGTGAWGSAPPPNSGAGAWGSASSNGLGGGNAPGGPNAGGDDLGQSNQKLLNSSGGGGPVSSAASGVVGVSAANVMTSQQQPTANNPVAAPPSAVGGSTSWAAAAGKGLPPQPEPTTNGAANKPIEVLNSLREALYSPDGWGGQNVKQDTSWDIGGSVPEPAVPTIAVKQDAMQWQSTSTGRNDGTDLWKSNLSGVPPPAKPQPQTPWGNHTPAHPADYKTWGEPEDDNNGPSVGSGNNSVQQGGPPSSNVGGPGPVDPRRGGPGGNMGDNGVGNSWDDGPSGPPQGAPQPNNQPWDTDPGKGKEDNWGTPAPSANQWGSSAQISAPSNMQMEPRMDGNGGGWGAPPPVKPAPSAGGWGAPQGPARGSGADQWHNESPSAARRMDDGGTGIWGKGGVQSGAPGGGWKDMPVPNLGPRAPPGPPTRMPPGGPGMKPGDGSPWGNQQLQNRSWGDDPMTSSNPWDAGVDKQRDMGMSGAASSGNGMPDFWHKKPMRTSPSWEDSAPGGGDMRGWGGSAGNRPQFTKETIWSSKQFRVLMDMNFRKEEAETALRNTNMQLEDAIDLLNNMNRGQMPNRGGMPPSADTGFGGPRGGGDPSYDMRFPNPGPGMPYPPEGLPPGSANPSLQNTSRGNMNPALVQPMTMMPGGGPPRPPQSGTPSTSQLRLLVQQIQMAVQAGHLNAQILNQPLAPQTLLLLNQLLQQIKLLQQCKSQQQQCMTSRGGQNNQGALLALSVQITKHNQNITNLQNQITVQQAQYLKSQQPASSMPPGGGAGLPPPTDPAELNLNLSNLSLTADQQAAVHHQAQGSKLNKWIKNDNSDDFSRAPGSSKSSTSQPSPNVLLEGGSTWSNGNNGAVSSGSGWPDSNDKNSNNNAADDSDFGIPEFVPGKAWKGSSMKDPSEDPTLTPGSVAANPLLHSQPHNDMKSSSSMIMSSQSSGVANSSAVENSLGLTSTTWSFGNNAGGAKDMMSNGGGVGGWGSGLPPSSSTSNLTTMGQDLWGMGPRGGKPSMSGWPSAAGGMSNGWSNGSNMPAGSAWLLLKNLTAQIDGSTLRTLCMQHGPLNNFQLFLTHGIALAKYSNGSEAKKAQNALNNCVLGNTTILAVVADEHEVETIVRSLSQGSGQGQRPPTSNPSYSNYSALAKSSSADSWSNLWSTSGGVGGGSVWGAPDDQHNRTTPLNSFIPTDLLSETM